VGLICIVGCIGLFITLPAETQVRFLIWNVIGLLCFFGFRRLRRAA
jgi:APA family basic amino acid/polyamine antiporter